jgi:hypothetical protein
MTKNVQFATGFLYGIIFPAIAWLVFNVVYKNLVLFNKPAIPYLVSIAINLFMLRYLIRNGKEVVGHGLMASTFVAAMAIFVFKLKA